MSWELVVGVEVHAQLRTGRKLFCRDEARFGDDPNRHVCPVCLGLPGALPVPDSGAVGLAVRTGLALECTVHRRSVWARKNYFYPDLPKGYQITQFEAPLATGGRVVFDAEDGEGVVRIRRVHMEEDAGRSVHDRLPGRTCIDLNRAGTPLVEIVTEPDLRSATDVRAFLTALKQILEYADVSDCNMEEGSLRADANVSLRRAGATGFGTKTEIKNVNSFSGIEKAVSLEAERQTTILEAGGEVEAETLLWDDHRQSLRPMRSKEESHDYRYFPDPDLPPLVLSVADLEDARRALPESPRARRDRFQQEYGLSSYDADVLTQTAQGADYFEAVAAGVGDAKHSANWVMGPAQALMKARGESPAEFSVPATVLSEIVRLALDGTISDAAGKRVLEAVAEGGGSPGEIVERKGLRQVRDEGALRAWIDEAMAEFPDEVARLRGGEARLLGFLVGQVMQRSRGSADPRRVNELLRERLG